MNKKPDGTSVNWLYHKGFWFAMSAFVVPGDQIKKPSPVPYKRHRGSQTVDKPYRMMSEGPKPLWLWFLSPGFAENISASFWQKRSPQASFFDMLRKNHTAIVLKYFPGESGGYRAIVRLVTSSDNPDYKNSIITAFFVSKKKWDKYLRNKKVYTKK